LPKSSKINPSSLEPESVPDTEASNSIVINATDCSIYVNCKKGAIDSSEITIHKDKMYFSRPPSNESEILDGNPVPALNEGDYPYEEILEDCGSYTR
jgi:hypothetical protein